LWKRLGFSNASHGAREITAQYRLPAAQLMEHPTRVIIHVTRPGQDPVTTVPFAVMMHEGPGGITFEKAPQDCPSAKPGLRLAQNDHDCVSGGGVCTSDEPAHCTGASCTPCHGSSCDDGPPQMCTGPECKAPCSGSSCDEQSPRECTGPACTAPCTGDAC